MSRITTVVLAGASGNLGPAILERLVEAGSNLSSITTGALIGQAAVVSILASTALERQIHPVEAAARAHVKQFIPSGFVSDTKHEKTGALPAFIPSVKVLDALKKHAAMPGELTYTAVVNGPFLDRGIITTTLPSIGKTVAAVLKHSGETKIRAVCARSTAITSKELLALRKKTTGACAWTENLISRAEHAAKAWDELQQP